MRTTACHGRAQLARVGHDRRWITFLLGRQTGDGAARPCGSRIGSRLRGRSDGHRRGTRTVPLLTGSTRCGTRRGARCTLRCSTGRRRGCGRGRARGRGRCRRRVRRLTRAVELHLLEGERREEVRGATGTGDRCVRRRRRRVWDRAGDAVRREPLAGALTPALEVAAKRVKILGHAATEHVGRVVAMLMRRTEGGHRQHSRERGQCIGRGAGLLFAGCYG
mmetsp:Transcript_8068/g.20366  ORF Transcript_8068/g.20366 Transcript_8068/m.20366 type:complete len:221 (+) Transcript_8068:1321-1983(+)